MGQVVGALKREGVGTFIQTVNIFLGALSYIYVSYINSIKFSESKCQGKIKNIIACEYRKNDKPHMLMH